MSTSDHRINRLRTDTVRGLACILLVMFHVVGNDSSSGLRVTDESVYRVVSDALSYVRMPLFTVLSGYIYALRPIVPGRAGSFLNGKARRLLVPLFVIGPIYLFMQANVSGVNQPGVAASATPLSLLYPFAQFWYLQALFVIFIAVSLLDRFGVLRGTSLGGVIIASAFLVLLPLPGFFSLAGAGYLFPFFLGGVAIKRLGWRRTVSVSVMLIVSAGEVSLGLLSAALLLRYFPPSQLLARIGVASFAIFLFHVFATAGTRIGFDLLGLDLPTPIALLAGTLAGVIAPMVLHRLASPVRAAVGVVLSGYFAPALTKGMLGQRR